jgi:hypothetical protein
MFLLKSNWRIFTNAASGQSAKRIASKVANLFGLDADVFEIQPYHKGGYTLEFCMDHGAENQSDTIVDVIEFGELIGRDWQLTGPIRYDPSGWSNSSTISGVTAMHWTVEHIP